MVEEFVEGAINSRGVWVAYLVLLLGAGVLTLSVEKLISYVTRTALKLGVSILTLAVVFTGFEFDDAVVALVFGAGGLERVALGTALGTALAITGVTLAVAAIVRPFPVDLPRDYILLFALSPLVLGPFVLLDTLRPVHGVLLVTTFLVLLGYIIYRESRRNVPVFRNSEIAERIEVDGGVPVDELDGGRIDVGQVLEPIPEDRFVSGRTHTTMAWLGLCVVALVGIVFGAILLETSSEAIVAAWGVEETVFGTTVLTLVLTFENLLLTIEPVRRGVPEIAIGHVIGSVLFSVTANVGVILFVAELGIPRQVLQFHLPAVIVLTALAAVFIGTGRLRRWHGYTLAGLYIVYWVIALLAFGGVPIP